MLSGCVRTVASAALLMILLLILFSTGVWDVFVAALLSLPMLWW